MNTNDNLTPVSLLREFDNFLDMDGVPVTIIAIDDRDSQYLRIVGKRADDAFYDMAHQRDSFVERRTARTVADIRARLTAEAVASVRANFAAIAEADSMAGTPTTEPSPTTKPTEPMAYFVPVLPEEEPLLACYAYIDGCENPAEWMISAKGGEQIDDEYERGLCTLHMHATFAYWLTQPYIDSITVERVQ